jgi:hypothetical protein
LSALPCSIKTVSGNDMHLHIQIGLYVVTRRRIRCCKKVSIPTAGGSRRTSRRGGWLLRQAGETENAKCRGAACLHQHSGAATSSCRWHGLAGFRPGEAAASCTASQLAMVEAPLPSSRPPPEAKEAPDLRRWGRRKRRSRPSSAAGEAASRRSTRATGVRSRLPVGALLSTRCRICTARAHRDSPDVRARDRHSFCPPQGPKAATPRLVRCRGRAGRGRTRVTGGRI